MKFRESTISHLSVKEIDLDNALHLTGIGWFHRWHWIVCGCGLLSTMIDLMNIGYLLSPAQCDLDLTTQDKGIVSAACPIGMILGSYFMGLLADVKGRKNILVVSLILESVTSIGFSLANHVYVLTFGRLLTGIFMSCPSSVIFAYIGEFHSETTRSQAIIWSCIFVALGICLAPGLAWLLLPLKWSFPLPWFPYNSWRAYMAICGLPLLVSAIGIHFTLPESPKFLLNRNRREEALEILRNIYSKNTGLKPEDYPVRALELTVPESTEAVSLAEIFRQQTLPLFKPPHLSYTLLTCFLQFGTLACANGLVIWLPEIYNRQSEYFKMPNQDLDQFCQVIERMGTKDNYTLIETLGTEFDVLVNNTTQECQSYINPVMFSNNLIMGLIQMLGYLLVGFLVKYIPKKFILMFCLCIAGSAGISLHIVDSDEMTVFGITCVFVILSGMCISLIASASVDIFPTSFRAMAVCVSMVMGRLGAMVGSLLIGHLLDDQCQLVFWLFGSLLIGCGLLSLCLP